MQRSYGLSSGVTSALAPPTTPIHPHLPVAETTCICSNKVHDAAEMLRSAAGRHQASFLSRARPFLPCPCLQSKRTQHVNTTTTSQPDLHLFRYTSGRWLWNEETQLRDRYSPFNVSELQNVAARSVGADACTGITKLAEGNFNKIFRLTIDNGKNVIARIPHPIAGSHRFMTASEVATMDFVRRSFQIQGLGFSHSTRRAVFWAFQRPKSSPGAPIRATQCSPNISLWLKLRVCN
jgi:hypothetical protein